MTATSLYNDALCSHIFDYACLKASGLLLSKRFEIMEKLYSIYQKYS